MKVETDIVPRIAASLIEKAVILEIYGQFMHIVEKYKIYLHEL